MKSIFVFCIGQGIDENIINRFYEITKKSTSLPIKVYVEVGNKKPDLLFNKSKLLNQVLKQNISKYDIILQTDIDLLMPPKMIDDIYLKICEDKVKNTFYHSRLRRCSLDEIQNLEYKNFPWDMWLSRDNILCTGCWNMGPSLLWQKCGGYNENMFGWGGEDDEFYKRSAKIHKAKWSVFKNYPLVHVNHPPRTQKRSKQNMSFADKDVYRNWLQ